MKPETINASSRKLQICIDIWQLARDALMLRFPFFLRFLSGLSFTASSETDTAGCDGSVVYYNPDFLIRSFRADPESAEELLLHMLYHCLFLHPMLDVPEDRELWNLACDISVSRLIFHYGQAKMAGNPKSGQTSGAENPQSCQTFRAENPQSRQTSGAGHKHVPSRHGSVLDPRVLYKDLVFLTGQMKACRSHAVQTPQGLDRISIVEYGFKTFPELLTAKSRLCPDDHRFWNRADKNTVLDRAGAVWDSLRGESGSGLYGSGGIEGSVDGLEEKLALRQKRAREFRRYLRRFAIHREEMTPDLSGFDYIPYLYGLKHYGNIPLIEHLEYQEINRLEELVIAIDTSGSCSVDTVRRFMEETYAILSDHENFFRKMNVYVIQCDCFVRDAVHITCEEDWKNYLKDLTIHGRSGTDFRPVFKYVEELRNTYKLKHLKGLLYFTDGDGIYPEMPTDYQTAFVFYREKEHHQRVPAWAATLYVSD